MQAGREDLLEQDALVGDVLVDDPHAILAGGHDETVEKLAQHPQVRKLAQVARRQVGQRFAAVQRGGFGHRTGGGRLGRRGRLKRRARPEAAPLRPRREFQRIGGRAARPGRGARKRWDAGHGGRSGRQAGEGTVDRGGGRQFGGRLGGDQPGADRVAHEVEHP